MEPSSLAPIRCGAFPPLSVAIALYLFAAVVGMILSVALDCDGEEVAFNGLVGGAAALAFWLLLLKVICPLRPDWFPTVFGN